MPALFEPLTIRSTTLSNRIWVAPMCQYSVWQHDGVPTDWHLAHLASFAVGGSALILTEATAVSPEGRISDRDTGLWNDEQTVAWQRITAFVREQGAVPGIQLAHAGRKASTYAPFDTDGREGSIPLDEGGWTTVSATDRPFEGYAAPEALDAAGIARVVDDFRAAARRSVDAGFDVIEIHAAHGYLLHQFLSPLSNDRDDEYGGALENRARLLLEIVDAVRAEIGDRPLFVRFSGTDWTEGGWDEHQTATVAAWARDAGADFFDISSGGNIAKAAIPVGPGYQVPLAESVAIEGGVATSAVGLITEPAQAEEIVASGRADAVMLARELLRDPHFALRAAHELGADIRWPGQYERARWRSSAR